MKYAILGSCVTRDLFDFEDARVARYVGRQTLVGMAAPPMPLMVTEPGWADRMVAVDASKTAFAEISRADADVILIDFIMEMMWVTKGAGCLSFEFGMRGADLIEAAGCEPDDDWPYMDRREAAADHYADALAKAARGRPIVLHEAWWACSCGDTVYDSNWVARQNDVLALTYAMLKRRLALWCVGVPPDQATADPEHRWGPAPYHYPAAYYAEVWRQLTALTATSHEELPVRSRTFG